MTFNFFLISILCLYSTSFQPCLLSFFFSETILIYSHLFSTIILYFIFFPLDCFLFLSLCVNISFILSLLFCRYFFGVFFWAFLKIVFHVLSVFVSTFNYIPLFFRLCKYLLEFSVCLSFIHLSVYYILVQLCFVSFSSLQSFLFFKLQTFLQIYYSVFICTSIWSAS